MRVRLGGDGGRDESGEGMGMGWAWRWRTVLPLAHHDPGSLCGCAPGPPHLFHCDFVMIFILLFYFPTLVII